MDRDFSVTANKSLPNSMRKDFPLTLPWSFIVLGVTFHVARSGSAFVPRVETVTVEEFRTG